MSWQGFRWIGTDAALAQANRDHAVTMQQKQQHAADLQKAIVLAKGRE